MMTQPMFEKALKRFELHPTMVTFTDREKYITFNFGSEEVFRSERLEDLMYIDGWVSKATALKEIRQLTKKLRATPEGEK